MKKGLKNCLGHMDKPILTYETLRGDRFLAYGKLFQYFGP